MERVRACRQRLGTAIPTSCLVIADHLSARSLCVTWIHWYVISFASKKGVGRQQTAFTSCQNTAFSNEFFSLAGRLCSGGFSFKWANVILAAFFILDWEVVKRILFFWGLLFLVGLICPLMQEYSLRLKKAHKSRAGRLHVKDRKTVYKQLIKSNRVLRTDQKPM